MLKQFHIITTMVHILRRAFDTTDDEPCNCCIGERTSTIATHERKIRSRKDNTTTAWTHAQPFTHTYIHTIQVFPPTMTTKTADINDLVLFRTSHLNKCYSRLNQQISFTGLFAMGGLRSPTMLPYRELGVRCSYSRAHVFSLSNSIPSVIGCQEPGPSAGRDRNSD